MLEFTYFEIQAYIERYTYTCENHYIKITDGDGTILMGNSCGSSSRDPSFPYYFLPPTITSISNRVEVTFHVHPRIEGGLGSGWSLRWSAVTPGECQQHAWILFDCLTTSLAFF